MKRVMKKRVVVRLKSERIGLLVFGLILLVAGYKISLIAQAQPIAQETMLMAEVARPDVTVRKVKLFLSDKEEAEAINARDAAGNSAFLRVILNDKISGSLKAELLAELLKHGVDITQEADNNGRTALMLAVERNYPEVVAFLLTQRYTTMDANLNQVSVVATIDQQDKQGRTALMYAAHMLHWDMIRLLEENGANATIKDKNGNDGCALALHHASFSPTESPAWIGRWGVTRRAKKVSWTASAKEDLEGRVVIESTLTSPIHYGHEEYKRCKKAEEFSIGGRQCGYRCAETGNWERE
jgi:ankyrin repeat protein